MALRDEIKAGRKELMENGTLKEKIAYFFDYYTLHTVVIAAVLIFAISFIYQQVTKPDIVLNGLLLNVLSFEEGDPVEDLRTGFMEYIDLDTKEYDMSLNSSLMLNMGKASQQGQVSDYEASQAMMVQCAAGAVDFISSPLKAIQNYGYGELFVNLENVLSEEDLEKYKPYLLYVDLAVVDKKNEAIDNDQNADEIPCPDPTKPEEMEEPIPVYIDLSSSKKLEDVYGNAISNMVFAITFNAPFTENAIDFLEYVME